MCVTIRSPWLEVILYATGMICLTASLGAFVSCIEPSPFSTIVWYALIGSGVLLMLLGAALLLLAAKIPDYSQTWAKNGALSTAHNGVTISVQDLITNEEVVFQNDSAIVDLHDAERLTKVIKSCMMIQTSSSDCINYAMDLFKETYV